MTQNDVDQVVLWKNPECALSQFELGREITCPVLKDILLGYFLIRSS